MNSLSHGAWCATIGLGCLLWASPGRGQAFSADVKALPFPPDAREVEFDETFEDVEYVSSSPLRALGVFYRAQMAARGWEEDRDEASVDADSIELTFRHGDAEAVVELDRDSDGEVDVSIDVEELTWEGINDPAALLAAGVPQPPSHLFLQAEFPLPAAATEVEYADGECEFKLIEDFPAAAKRFQAELAKLGWRENAGERFLGKYIHSYEYRRGPVTLEVRCNKNHQEGGTRATVIYASSQREPIAEALDQIVAAAEAGEFPNERFDELIGALEDELGDLDVGFDADLAEVEYPPTAAELAAEFAEDFPEEFPGDADLAEDAADYEVLAEDYDDFPGLEEEEEEEEEAPPTTTVVVDDNTGSATVTLGGQRWTFNHTAAYQSEYYDEPRTILIFTDQPIPFAKLQQLVAQDDHFFFGDLFGFDIPQYLQIEKTENYLSFSFTADGVGIGSSVDSYTYEIETADGRTQGTVKTTAPEEFFDKDFTFSATIDAGLMTPHTRVGSAAAAQAEVALAETGLRDYRGLYVPEDAEEMFASGSEYRTSVEAVIDAPLADVVAMYRQGMKTLKWRENEETAQVEADSATLAFEGAAATMQLELAARGDRTALTLASTNAEAARRDGVLPEPGKARLIMGNAHTAEVVIAIGPTEYKLRAGRGAEDLKDALNYTVPPGKYILTIKVPGAAPETETLTIREGTAWGVIALPTGGCFADQLY